jgi:glycolate oxidase FAD binding subunit
VARSTGTDRSAAELDELAEACDGAVATAGDDDAVAGVPARYVARPTSTQQVARVLRVTAGHDLAVVPRGRGTRLGWGAPPRRADLVLDTTGITGVVEHAAGDLIVVVRAGTPLPELQETLAGHDQQLALDGLLAGSSVGGTVATSPSGPRRLLYGTVRDLLIGITFVRADGVVARAGGKVVKNVAGYDFGKLLTGSYGTLGVVTEAVFRLHPLAPRRHVVVRAAGDPLEAVGSARRVLGSQVVPSAVELDLTPDGQASVAAMVEGTDEGVSARVQALCSVLGAPAGDGEAPGWWGAYPFGPGDVGVKLTTEVTGLGPLLASARETGERHGVPVAVRGSAGGALHAGLPGDAARDSLAAAVDDLRAAAHRAGGTAVVLTAPASVRDGLDLWGPVPGLALMRRLKAEMDPGGRLAPGRFVGGI